MDQIINSYIAREENYQKGDTILQEESKSEWVYIILEGEIKIRKHTPRGLVTLTTLKEGAFLGEMLFLSPDETGRSVSAIAASRLVRVGLIDSQRLIRDYESVSPRMKTIIQSLVRKLRTANDKVCDIVVNSK